MPRPPRFLHSALMLVSQFSKITPTTPFSASMGSSPNFLGHLDKPTSDISSRLLSDKELSAAASYQAMLSTLFVLLGNHQTLLKESRRLPRSSRFSKLPLELRLMIWRHAGKEGQIIGTTARKMKAKQVMNGTDIRSYLLLVCKESRKEVLETRINFNAAEVNANTTSAGVARIYVNLEVDSIWVQDFKPSQLDRQGFGRICQSLVVHSANLQRLVIHSRTLGIFGMAWLFQLNLKELTLVVNHRERTDCGSETTLVPPQQTFDSYFAGLTKAQERDYPDQYQGGSLRWFDVARSREDRIRNWGVSMQQWYMRDKDQESMHPALRDLSDWTVPWLRYVDVLYPAGEVVKR